MVKNLESLHSSDAVKMIRVHVCVHVWCTCLFMYVYTCMMYYILYTSAYMFIPVHTMHMLVYIPV